MVKQASNYKALDLFIKIERSEPDPFEANVNTIPTTASSQSLKDRSIRRRVMVVVVMSSLRIKIMRGKRGEGDRRGRYRESREMEREIICERERKREIERERKREIERERKREIERERERERERGGARDR